MSKYLFSWPQFSRERITSTILAVFMLQVIAAGFCMPTANASTISQHAAQQLPISHQPMSIVNHCQGMQTATLDKAAEHHPATKHICAHCDAPDQIFAQHGPTLDYSPLLLLFSLAMPLLSMPSLSAGLPLAHAPTGPPDSSSLLYTTTQRIRI